MDRNITLIKRGNLIVIGRSLEDARENLLQAQCLANHSLAFQAAMRSVIYRGGR